MCFPFSRAVAALLFSLLLVPVYGAAQRSQPMVVVASIEPLAMLARDVFADTADVKTLLLPSQSPHTTAFTPGQMRLLAQADLFLWLGEAAEPKIAKLQRSSGSKAAVELALLSVADIQLLYGNDVHGGDAHREHAHAHHDHGMDHRVDHGEHSLDLHMWLSPENMSLMAAALVEKAKTLAVANEDELDKQLFDFQRALKQHVSEINAALEDVRDVAYIGHHDPWGYFANAFGLQRTLVVSPSMNAGASARRFTELVTQMQADNINCILLEPEARKALMKRLCEYRAEQCRMVERDPLGRDLSGQGYTVFLRHIADGFQQCLAAQ